MTLNVCSEIFLFEFILGDTQYSTENMHVTLFSEIIFEFYFGTLTPVSSKFFISDFFEIFTKIMLNVCPEIFSHF